MKKLVLTLVTATLSAATTDAQNFAWARQISSLTSTDQVQCAFHSSMTIDGSGDIYSIGTFGAAADFNPSAATAILNSSNGYGFVQKMNSGGSYLWAQQLAGSPTSVTVDASANVYVAGSTNTASNSTDVFIAKLNSSGSVAWTKQFGGIFDDRANAIAVDGSGHIYVAGRFRETATVNSSTSITSQGSGDMFICKLDGNGVLLWIHSFGAAGNDAGEAMALDNLGQPVIAGRFSGTIDFDPSPTTGYALTPTNATGSFFLKLDGSGNLVWAKHIDPLFAITKMAIDGVGNIHTTGSFSQADFDPGPNAYLLGNPNSSGNIFFLKLNGSGDFVWAREIGGNTAQEYGFDLAVDASANVYGAGYFQTTIDFDPGPGSYTLSANNYTETAYVLKLNSAGNFGWARKIGGSSNSETWGRGIAVSALGEVYTACHFSGKIDADPGTKTFSLTSKGTKDVAVVKLTQPAGTFKLAQESEEPLAIAASDATKVKLSPNPNKGSFTLTGIVSNATEEASIEIRDIAGRVVARQNALVSEGRLHVPIQLNGITPGMYFLLLRSGEEVMHSRFIIE